MLEDAIQETAVKVILNYKSFANASQFSTWMISIFQNECFNLLNHKKRELNIFENLELEDNDSYSMKSRTPTEITEHQNKCNLLMERAIALLSVTQRVILRYHCINEWNDKKIASELGTKDYKIRYQRKKAISSLKLFFRQEEYFEEIKEIYFEEQLNDFYKKRERECGGYDFFEE